MIKVKNKLFDSVSVTEVNNTLRLSVEADVEIDELIKNVSSSSEIELLENEVVIKKIKGEFIQPRLIDNQYGKTIVFYKKSVGTSVLDAKISDMTIPLSIMFVQLSQSKMLDDITISEHAELFPEWSENWTGKAGTILREGEKLYRSIHDITTVAQNTKPSETPSMWTLVANPDEEYPEWVQPIGVHDTYALGDKVSRNDKHWISVVDNNVWQPSVYGWEEVE